MLRYQLKFHLLACLTFFELSSQQAHVVQLYFMCSTTLVQVKNELAINISALLIPNVVALIQQVPHSHPSSKQNLLQF